MRVDCLVVVSWQSKNVLAKTLCSTVEKIARLKTKKPVFTSVSSLPICSYKLYWIILFNETCYDSSHS